MIVSNTKPVKSNSINWQLIVGKGITYSVILALLLFPISTNGTFGIGQDLKIKTIVIDAGHGGHDTGCLGHTRVNEKKVALSIALKLGAYIEEKLPDVKVIYTRSTDVFVELEERAAIANRNKADLFISIHCNAASSAAFGTETYVMGLHKTEGNLNVAKRENSVMELEDNYEERYGFDPNSVESYIMLSLTQDAYLEQSTDLAARIQEQFRERVGRHDRGVKAAGFWVLWRTAMPSVLVETGFLTNPEEEKFLNSEQGQDFIASALFRAFRDYKINVEKTATALEILPTPAPAVKMDTPAAETTMPSSMTYRVQLLVSSKEYDSYSKKFKDVDKLMVEHLDNGLYRYSAGPYGSEQAARQTLGLLSVEGFGDAFIAVYDGSERVQIIKNN